MNRNLRSLLVSCGHYIIGPFGPESDLRNYGLSIIVRGGKNAKKRAAVALARKLVNQTLDFAFSWKTSSTLKKLNDIDTR